MTLIPIVIGDDKVSISQGGSQRDTVITQNKAEITITNSPGVELHHAGGSGTNMIYLFGVMLSLAAIYRLLLAKFIQIWKKRKAGLPVYKRRRKKERFSNYPN